MITREQCHGCHNDYYNIPGNTFSGDRCWSAEKGTMAIRYAIGTWTTPTQPGAFQEVRVPSCYHRTGTHYYRQLPDFVRVEDVIRRTRAKRSAP